MKQKRISSSSAPIGLLSCAFEARNHPWSRQAIGIARETASGATIIGTGSLAAPGDAAFANATMGHGLVREDMHAASVSHHGVVIWPTLLALSERTALSGMTFLGAAIIGYEAGAQIGRALITADLARLYRPTGLVGPLGAALAALHGMRPTERPVATGGTVAAVPLPPFTRLDPSRLAAAAEVLTRARPDVAARAARLFGRLETAAESGRGPAVCLHGDANLRNAIRLDDGRVGLIDLEHVSAGPAAADLGQLLAGWLLRADREAAGAALLAGYACVAPPPDGAALRWHTAASALARIALPAVGRVRRDTLARLPELLDTAAGLLAARTAVAA